jgi:iron(III) transport system permease protein
LAGFGVFITALPLIYIVLRTAEIPAETFFSLVFNQRVGELTTNSLTLVLAVTLTATSIGVLQAILVHKTEIRFKSLFTLLAVLPLAIPSYIAALGWMSAVSGFRGFTAAWMVLSFGTAPYVFLAVSASLLLSNPALEEVARSLGRNGIESFRSVIWPNIRLAVAGSGLIVALYTLSDFGAVSLLQFDTFTRAIFNSYRSSFDRTTAAALATVVVLITVVFVFVKQRWFGTETMPSKIGRPHKYLAPNFQKFGGLVLLLWATLALFVPLLSISRWAFIGQSSADFGEIFRAVVNTLSFAGIGAAVTALIAFAVALIRYRSRSRVGKTFEVVAWLSHALPGIVIALTLVFFSNRFVPAIYQTSALVIIAYVALFLPNAVTALANPIQQIPTSLDEVARSLGKTRHGVVRTVLLPNLRVPLVSAFALVALTIVKELPATLLLRPTGIETLASRLWSASGINAFASAAPYAIIMILLAGIPALLLNREITTSLRGVDSLPQPVAERN